MDPQLLIIAVALGLVTLVVTALVLKWCWHSIPQEQALIINRAQGEPQVSFRGAFVLPLVQRAERIELGVRKIEIDRRGKDGVMCKDCIRADIKFTFFVRVNATSDDILKVARTIGSARAADLGTLEELFAAKFADAIKTAAAYFDFEQLFSRRLELKDEIVAIIGSDLNGYRLDDAVIDYVEQTPIEALDPNNILDAQGIKKILESSLGLTELRHRQRMREATAETSARQEDLALRAELERLGLLDLRVASEVSCDVAPGRKNLSITFGDDPEAAAAQLPTSLPRAVISTIGHGQLTCSDGRATVRWQTRVTTPQLIAGARLVHALREVEQAFR